MTNEEKENLGNELYQKAMDLKTGKVTGKPDSEAAVPIYKAAAEYGNVGAMVELGAYYYSRMEFEDAYHWFLEAALAGSAIAMCDLGGLYHNGYFVEQDYKKAYEYFLKSYDSGFKGVCLNLGNYAAFGHYGPQGYQVAAKYYREGIENGDVDCVNSLAYLYDNGDSGFPSDKQKAAGLYRLAAERGDSLACHNLALLYERGEGVERDLRKALEWYKKGVLLGSQACLDRYNKLNLEMRYNGQ
ncbi:MAG: sel1 repeat family protein [Clostridiales bacterium]|nr:sel1 repeat family protein [Clostridiales bacterium]